MAIESATVLAQLPTSEARAYPAGTRVRLNLRTDPVLVSPLAPAGATG